MFVNNGNLTNVTLKTVHIYPWVKFQIQSICFNDSNEYVIVCHHGIRSRTVAIFLEQNGVKNLYNLTGGIAKWSDDVDPTMEKY